MEKLGLGFRVKVCRVVKTVLSIQSECGEGRRGVVLVGKRKTTKGESGRERLGQAGGARHTRSALEIKTVPLCLVNVCAEVRLKLFVIVT